MLTQVALIADGKKIPCDSFDKAEMMFYEMMARKQYNKQNGNDHSLDQLYKNDCSPAKPVDVDSTVMKYIEKKYPEELKKVTGKDVEMAGGKMFFNSKQTVLAHFARQKFITFYQKIATELQKTTLEFKPSQMKLLEAEFPDLLITPYPNKHLIIVMGGYVSIERLERFLKNNCQSPVRSIGHTAQKASIKDSATPATQDSKKDEETCPICMDTLTEKETLPKCKHSFCKDCLKRAFEFKPACPICGVLYGKLKGTQPDKGSMKVTYEATSHLPGYERYGTIVINYYIPSGIQGVSIHQFTLMPLCLDLAKFCQANSVTCPLTCLK